MKRKRILFSLAAGLFTFAPSLHAQDPAAQAAALAERRDAEESYRILAGKIEDMHGIISSQRNDIASLRNEVAILRDALQTERSERAKAAINYATRDDLKKLVDKLQEIERKRESDKELVLKEIQRLAKIAATPAPPPPEPKPAKETKAEPSDAFFTHKVKEGQTLSAIIEAYNAKLKAEGKGRVTLDQVKKANPNMDINHVVVGREILIPVPAHK